MVHPYGCAPNATVLVTHVGIPMAARRTHPRHTRTLPIIPALSPSYPHSPRHTRTLPVIPPLSPSLPHSPHHSRTLPRHSAPVYVIPAPTHVIPAKAGIHPCALCGIIGIGIVE